MKQGTESGWVCESCGKPGESRLCHECRAPRPQGTEWTEPGNGATVVALIQAGGFQGPRVSGWIVDAWTHDVIALGERLEKAFDSSVWQKHHTNLRLTGAPLTAEDVARIAEAK